MADAGSLFERRKRVYKMLEYLTEVEDEEDPGGFADFDPIGRTDETIRREWRSHVECLREYEGHMHCALRAMEGVLEYYKDELTRLSEVWYKDFRGAYEVFRAKLHEDTVGKSHQELAQQVVDTRALFTQFFEKCFMVQEESRTDKRQSIVMYNNQLLESVRQFACWVQLDVNALRAKYENVPDDLLPQIALAVATDNKEHWHSTQYRVYAKSIALALALEHKDHWYSTHARVYARSRRDSI